MFRVHASMTRGNLDTVKFSSQPRMAGWSDGVSQRKILWRHTGPKRGKSVTWLLESSVPSPSRQLTDFLPLKLVGRRPVTPKFGLLVGWLVQHPSNMLVYLRDGSAQTILRAATLR